MNRDKLAPLTGIGFVVLAIISIAVMGGEPPGADDPANEIVQHYVDNKDAVFVSAAIGMLAVAMLVFFAAHLRKVLAAADPGGSVHSVVLAGAAILAVALTIDGTISIALAEGAEDIEPSGVQTLQALWDNDFLPIALGTFLFFVSSGISILLSGVLPKWLGGAAIVISLIGASPLFFVGFPLGGIWIVIVSVMLSRRAGAEEAGTAGPTGAPASPGV